MKTEEMFAGFNVAVGDDRFGEHIKLGGPGGQPNDCKVCAQDTEGAMSVFEFTGPSGGPRHLHRDQDEWIYILEGEFDFQVGDKRFRLGPGESIFIPRKTSHAWGCINAAPGKIINVYQPAGKMEEFFRELGKPPEWLITADEVVNKTYTEEQVKAMDQFFDAHGMDLLGLGLGSE